MSLALESVCDTLKLRLTDDPNTRLVASKIIELAQRGVRDAPTLSARTLKEFKHFWGDPRPGSLAIFAAIRRAFEDRRLVGFNRWSELMSAYSVQRVRAQFPPAAVAGAVSLTWPDGLARPRGSS
jgi:hypothetical protein